MARHLGVSVATVRRLEGVVLHPEISDARVRWFDPEEVSAVRESRAARPPTPKESDGAVAARVFELFKRGASLADVVISTKVHPSTVRDLYGEWVLSLEDGEEERRFERCQKQDQLECERMNREALAIARRTARPTRR